MEVSGSRRLLTSALIAALSSCSLFVSLDGLDDGGVSASDASSDTAPVDASSGDAGTDAAKPPTKCDPSAPWDTISPLFSSPDFQLFKITLAADEQEAWYAYHDQLDASGPSGIARAVRQSDGGFPPPLTSEIDSVTDPGVTYDGLRMIYAAYGAVGGFDLFSTERPDRTTDFVAGAILTSVSSSKGDVAPFVAADGSLWFVSARDETTNHYDVFRAAPNGNDFDAPVHVTEFDESTGGFGADGIVLSRDLLTAYFTSDRTDLPHVGSNDIFRATRSSTSDAFGSFVNEGSLNAPGGERATWISTDMCRIYFESDRDVGFSQLYVATKTLSRDF